MNWTYCTPGPPYTTLSTLLGSNITVLVGIQCAWANLHTCECKFEQIMQTQSWVTNYHSWQQTWIIHIRSHRKKVCCLGKTGVPTKHRVCYYTYIFNILNGQIQHWSVLKWACSAVLQNQLAHASAAFPISTQTLKLYTVKTFGLLQSYFGHLSCMSVV